MGGELGWQLGGELGWQLGGELGWQLGGELGWQLCVGLWNEPIPKIRIEAITTGSSKKCAHAKRSADVTNLLYISIFCIATAAQETQNGIRARFIHV